jgi:hypothetical protein
MRPRGSVDGRESLGAPPITKPWSRPRSETRRCPRSRGSGGCLRDAESRSNGSSLADTRDRLVTFLTQATTATQTAVTELQAAGAPSIKNGDKIAAIIVKEVTAIRDAFIKAADGAHALSTSNRSAFQREIDAVGKQIDAAGKQAGQALNAAKKRFNTKVLSAAQSKDPSCNGQR